MAGKQGEVALRRVLTLPELVAYGVGTTVGAGIYVLIGKVAGLAGAQGVYAFLLACVAVVLPATAYAEFVGRVPTAAGSAGYVARGTRLAWLGTLAGILVGGAGLLSSAALALGAAGYLARWLALPQPAMALALVSMLALVAMWGIRESVWLAGLITLMEVGVLVAVLLAGLAQTPDEVLAVVATPPPVAPEQAAAVLAATLLTFFAFIGFEDMVTVAEEAKEPGRAIPRAIFITLVVTLVLYVGVYAVALAVADAAALAASSEPLALVAERLHAVPAPVVGGVAVVAVINGVLIQIVMASRILYGLARAGHVPAVLGRVHARRRTPMVAIALCWGIIALLVLALPVEQLAAHTSRLVLAIYALVCLSLLLVKWRGEPAPAGVFRAPVPLVAAGLVICVFLLVMA